MNATLTQPDPVKARAYFSDKMEFTTGPVELKRMIDQDDLVVVVDVREAEDFAEGHIPGAINLPKDKWDQREGLRRDATNVLYCYSQVCHLAPMFAVCLAAEGYPVKELEGGFEGWKEHELPIETGAAGDAKGAIEEPVTAAGRSPRQENL